MFKPLILICFDILLYPIEFYFKKKNEVGILKYQGEFTNKLISIFCLYQIIYLSVLGKDPASTLLDYFIYDISWILSKNERIKRHFIFIIYHIFTILLCYLGKGQNFGTSIYAIFEITSPLLHITKISQAIAPRHYLRIKAFTKEAYFLFRCLVPPFWVIFKLLTHYNGTIRHTIILSGITALWQASIAWHKKF